MGRTRIVQALTAHDSYASALFLNESVLPFLEVLGQEKLTHGTFKSSLDDLLHLIFMEEKWMEGLARAVQMCRIAKPLPVGWLVLQAVKIADERGTEARKETVIIRRIVDALKANGDPVCKAVAKEIETCTQGGNVTAAAGSAAAVSGRSIQSLQHSFPGGRFDNDHASYRDVRIVPTPAELLCNAPYLPTGVDLAAVAAGGRAESEASILDRNYRLLREDFVAPMREEFASPGGQRTFQRAKVLRYFTGKPLHAPDPLPGQSPFKARSTMIDRAYFEVTFQHATPQSKSVAYWEKHKRPLGRQSLVCFVKNGTPVCFGVVEDRREAKLAREQPIIGVCACSPADARVLLWSEMQQRDEFTLVQVDCSFFAVEPILRGLLSMTALPFAPELVAWKPSVGVSRPAYPNARYKRMMDRLEGGESVTSVIQSDKANFALDRSQTRAVITSLQNRVALVQGPPGTGKSFVGALLTKALLDTTNEIVLVCCFTNHALDQFLLDLLAHGVDRSSLVRVGGGEKVHASLDDVRLKKLAEGQKRAGSNAQFQITAKSIETQQEEIEEMQARFAHKPNLLNWLQQHEKEWAALFLVHAKSSDGMQLVGGKQKGKKKAAPVDMYFLLNAWQKGQPRTNPAVDELLKRNKHSPDLAQRAWAMTKAERQAQEHEWRDEMQGAQREAYLEASSELERSQQVFRALRAEGQLAVLSSCRIIGCTTTGAAIHREALASIGAGVLVVEEACEVLEAHVLTALSTKTKHLIMIGDHEQLRPKIQDYKLEVASGHGYNLNQSLFERLVHSQYPYATLLRQHRMHPQISSFVRGMTYPLLEDAVDSVSDATRPAPVGLQRRVTFIDHRKLEDACLTIRQANDGDGGTHSKINSHEVEMIVRTLIYVLQQGQFGESQIVILTPYLGQLSEIRDRLNTLKGIRAELSELDDKDLRQAEDKAEMAKKKQQEQAAAAAPAAAASASSAAASAPGPAAAGASASAAAAAAALVKATVRLATIDNYQGEESDVVLASLVRSNPRGDVGFVSQKERINVLLSRARCAMVLIGNAETLVNCKNAAGRKLWKNLMERMLQAGAVHKGLPVCCPRHPSTMNVLQLPEHFSEHVPDGGCRTACGEKLVCGRHYCPRRCHSSAVDDHKQACTIRIPATCAAAGHAYTYPCPQHATLESQVCTVCEKMRREREAAERKAAEAAKQRAEQVAREQARIAKLQAERDSLATELAAAEQSRQRQLEEGHLRAETELQRMQLVLRQSLQGRQLAEQTESLRLASQARLLDEQQAMELKLQQLRVSVNQRTAVLQGNVDPSKAAAPLAKCAAKAPPNALFSKPAAIPAAGAGGPAASQTARATVQPTAVPKAPTADLKQLPRAASAGGAAPAAAAASASAAPSSRLSAPAPSPVLPNGAFPASGSSMPLPAGLVQDDDPTLFLCQPCGVRITKSVTAVNGHCGSKKHVEKQQKVSAKAGAPAAAAGGVPLKPQLPATKPPSAAAPLEPAVQKWIPRTESGSISSKPLQAPTASPSVSAAPKLPAASSAASSAAPSPKAVSMSTVSMQPALQLLADEKYLEAFQWLKAKAPTPPQPPSDATYLLALATQLLGTPARAELLRLEQRCQHRHPAGSASTVTAYRVLARFHAASLQEVAEEDQAEEGRQKAEHRDDALLWADAALKSSPPADVQQEMLALQSQLQSLSLSPAAAVVSEASRVAQDWAEERDARNGRSAALEDLMKLTGLAKVKREMLNLFMQAHINKNQGMDFSKLRHNVLLLGNPGTGKTTVARLYCRLLIELGALPAKAQIRETTGALLNQDGVAGLQKLLGELAAAGGGLLFVDETYQLALTPGSQGAGVLNVLLTEMENKIGSLTVAFAGYRKSMEAVMTFNEGLPSRFPRTLDFADYSDEELIDIARRDLERRSKGARQPFVVEGGPSGLYMRVLMRRLGRGRGRVGFGNARAVQTTLDAVFKRQSERLQRDRVSMLDAFRIEKEDVVGVRPSRQRLLDCPAWKQLQGMIGLASVKAAIESIANLLEQNYDRELQNKAPIHVSLNRVLVGNPGTGKTTVARLFGSILSTLGVLSKGELQQPKIADFIGNVLGASESKTKAILDASQGCVLLVDEAYSLNPKRSGSGGGGSEDPFRGSVIDTLVEGVQNVPGEDRCVLMVGYEQDMERFFNDVNPGMRRRFGWEARLNFSDYSKAELHKIFTAQLKAAQLTAAPDVGVAVSQELEKRKKQSNFGNAGAVEQLLGAALLARTSRLERLPAAERALAEEAGELLLVDVQAGQPAARSIDSIFSSIVGCDSVLQQVRELRDTIAFAAKRGKPDAFDDVPRNFIFMGPPGTGKTSVARLMGEVFVNFGLLSSASIVEKSASDLSTGFVGQAGPQTLKVLREALGKVLLIDEAYMLSPRRSQHSYGGQSLDELVKALTSPEFHRKLVVILAGYQDDMHELLSANAGLSSRFPGRFLFEPFSLEHCWQLVHRTLAAKSFQLEAGAEASLSPLLAALIASEGWGNGRDLGELCQAAVRQRSAQPDAGNDEEEVTTIGSAMMRDAMQRMLGEKTKAGAVRIKQMPAVPAPAAAAAPAAATAFSIATPKVAVRTPTRAVAAPPREVAPPGSAPAPSAAPVPPPAVPLPPAKREAARVAPADGRDVGVSDAVWSQLSHDRSAQEAARLALEEELDELRDAEAAAQLAAEIAAEEAAATARRLKAVAHEKLRPLLQQLAEERNAQLLREQKELERLRQLKADLERERAHEAAAQSKLRSMGVCVAGYAWIKQHGGYRCAGGSHFVSDAQLA